MMVFRNLLLVTIACWALAGNSGFSGSKEDRKRNANLWAVKSSVTESHEAVVAADDGRCSEVGVSILTKGGHAVDAAIASALCLGVVSPTSSGIGGGGFIVVRDSSFQSTVAYNMRETAPSAASRDMYEKDTKAKSGGPLSVGVPGELAGLHAAWSDYGRLPWRVLFEPAIEFAKKGFVISPFTGYYLAHARDSIMNDPGLRQVFVRNGELLRAGDVCYNVELGKTLEAIAQQGPEAFYDGPIGERLVDELEKAGGILKMEDLRNYSAKATEAVSIKAFGHEILGVPPPSSGALGLGLVLKVLDGYKSKEALSDPVGPHRLAEAMKHMFAVRMNLGDPDFEDVEEAISKMLSPSFADEIRGKIHDDTTFSAEHYNARWSQLIDHGTSHICAVDADRNVVSMTTTLNYRFGGGMRSVSTGIILNNQMDDFSVPTEKSKDNLPPAETNSIKPNKRPLSSLTPIIVLKENQFAGAMGCGGGLDIIPAVTQIFINHFILGMEPFEAVRSPRIYHSLDPEEVSYENWTVYNGEHYEVSEERKQSLRERGHRLEAKEGGAICQFVAQNLKSVDDFDQRLTREDVFRGMLTAVSDPRKGGWPAGVDSRTVNERVWDPPFCREYHCLHCLPGNSSVYTYDILCKFSF